jgi:RimJ/RimL family protein N-acetyltransferase
VNLTFEDVYGADGKATTLALAILYSHLEQRTPEQSISHKTMPTWDQHCAFIGSRPHAAWWLVYDRIEAEGDSEGACEYVCIGQAYFTRGREIGIAIGDAYQRQGYASEIITKVIEMVPRGPVFANVSPHNIASQKLFESLGFSVVQLTFRLDPIFFDEPLYQGHPAGASRWVPGEEAVAIKVESSQE